MKSYARILGLAGMVCIFATLLTSCATHSKLGCPMKITKVPLDDKTRNC